MNTRLKIALSGVLLAGGLIAASGASLAAPPPTAGVKSATPPAAVAPDKPSAAAPLTSSANRRNGVTGYNGGSLPVALTPNECKGLGGKVIASTLCKSGSNCATVDKSGVIRTSCIDEKDPK